MIISSENNYVTFIGDLLNDRNFTVFLLLLHFTDEEREVESLNLPSIK